ncbi:MAG: phosphoglycerate kinase [Cellulomonadaceae bacterium]|jgi:phosphoglycerate kinase|nr:phosphoglycerate kinase [Cellulomonadaceae bacterium]
MKTIEDLGDLNGKTVLVRSDFNVPMKDGVITDDTRIRAAVPTIKKLTDRGAKVVVTAHLGRPAPSGDVFEYEDKYSVKPTAARLGELIGQTVPVAADLSGPSAKATVAALQPGQVAMLENVRFDPRETSKDAAARETLANELVDATGASAYVSDGFGVVHRKQASVYDVAKAIPSAAAGDLVFKEVDSLSRATTNPQRPYAVVLGGAKVSDKLGVIDNLIDKSDKILIGGAMANTFLKAKGYDVGTSRVEDDQLETVKGYLAKAEAKGTKIVLPVDVVTAESFDGPASNDVYKVSDIPATQMALDIGPETGKLFADELADAKTIAWNGPMGVFERPEYAGGTRAVMDGMISAKNSGAFTVVGGGDSAAAVNTLNYGDSDFSHISTGGGASLELLEGKVLPGIDVLG